MSATEDVSVAQVGIDFGTSNTVGVVAVPGRGPRVLLFDGSPLLPSGVCVDPTGRLLTGRDAWHTAMAVPAGFEPYPKQRVDDGVVLLGGAEFGVPRLFAAVLDRVLLEASNVTSGGVDGPVQVVVTCPVAWGGARRGALLAAAPPGARLVAEPVAAAHYFTELAGHQLPDGGAAVVHDFGAGTFDAAVVRRAGDGFVVVASRGLTDCGGLDVDAAIVAHLATVVPDASGWARLTEPVSAADRRARQQLWTSVRAAKEMLSRATTTLVYLPVLDVEVPLGREELDRLAAPIVDRTVATVREVVARAGVDAGELAAIFLSGGSSRMPLVATSLHRAFGIAPVTVDQPEMAVAEGSLRAIAATTASGTPTPTPVATTTVALADTAGGQPPTLPLAAPAAGAQRWHRRGPLTVTAALGALVLIVAIVFAFSRGKSEPQGSKSGPSSPAPAGASPPPSYPPGIDPCLLGTWRTTVMRVYGLIDGNRVQYVGGAGEIWVYNPDGTSATDYNQMQPMVVVVNRVTWANVFSGTSSSRYHAENGQLIETDIKSNAVGILRRNGQLDNTAPITYFLEPTSYRCIGDTLTTYSEQGNFSNEAVRVKLEPKIVPRIHQPL